MRIRTKLIGLAAVPCVALLATNINSWNELRQTSGLALKAVAESSQSVASAATEIAASNEEMSAGLAVQSEQTQQVAEATQRMAETASQVANRSSEGGQVVSQTIE